jgi:hypothetical protein
VNGVWGEDIVDALLEATVAGHHLQTTAKSTGSYGGCCAVRTGGVLPDASQYFFATSLWLYNAGYKFWAMSFF